MADEKEISAYLNGANPAASITDYTGKNDKGYSYYGDALNDGNVNEIVGEETPHVIILIGFPKYGKSTFVASLYHLALSSGKIGEYTFVDSDTITGFERRAHIRKLEHKLKNRMDRTQIYENYFLSLLLKNENTGKKVKLVISDRSGETYHQYSQSADDIMNDRALKYATHLVFFLDATIIASDKFMDMMADLNPLLTRMKSSGVFDENKTVDVVYNKIDCLVDNRKSFDANKVMVESQVQKRTSINQTFEISSLSVMQGNSNAEVFIKYLLENCPSEKEASDEVLKQLDWAKVKIQNNNL